MIWTALLTARSFLAKVPWLRAMPPSEPASHFFCLLPSLRRVLQIGKPTEFFISSINLDAGPPLSQAGAPEHSVDARLVVRLPSSVSLVCRVSDGSKIANSVVRPNAVDVVDHHRPLPVINSPSNAMGRIGSSEDGACEIAGIECGCEGNGTLKLSVPSRAIALCCSETVAREKRRSPISPPQNASLRVVTEKLAQKLRFNYLLGSHIRTPNAYVGQGRALLSQRFRPDFYSRFTVRSQMAGALI